jgi:hypothetical protein
VIVTYEGFAARRKRAKCFPSTAKVDPHVAAFGVAVPHQRRSIQQIDLSSCGQGYDSHYWRLFSRRGNVLKSWPHLTTELAHTVQRRNLHHVYAAIGDFTLGYPPSRHRCLIRSIATPPPPHHRRQACRVAQCND